MGIRANTLDDFFSFVDFSPEQPNGECWDWTGKINNKGYGVIRLSQVAKTRYAHRIMYQLNFCTPPDNLDVCHTCDRPCCVNPAHLFLGTRKDNMQDCARKGRNNLIRLTEQQETNMRDLFSKGVPLREIAARFNMSWPTVSRICGPSWKIKASKFTSDQKAEMLAMHKNNATYATIAQHFSISIPTTRKVLFSIDGFVPHKRGNPLHRK